MRIGRCVWSYHGEPAQCADVDVQLDGIGLVPSGREHGRDVRRPLSAASRPCAHCLGEFELSSTVFPYGTQQVLGVWPVQRQARSK